MKIEFEDKSYIECNKSDHPGKVVIAISAKDYKDPLKKITNTVELSIDDLRKLVAEVL